MPHLGISRLFWITKVEGTGHSDKKGIVLSLYKPTRELLRHSFCGYQGWAPSTSPAVVFSPAPGLSIKEDVWVHLHCGMLTHLHLCCFYQKGRHGAHSEHLNSFEGPSNHLILPSVFYKRPIPVLMPSPPSLFKIIIIICFKKSTTSREPCYILKGQAHALLTFSAINV